MASRSYIAQAVRDGADEFLRMPWRLERLVSAFDYDRDEIGHELLAEIRRMKLCSLRAGRARHWTYDPNRLIALRQAYVAVRYIVLKRRSHLIGAIRRVA